MDFEILPQLIIILSVAGILAIVGRNFSKMKEAGNEEIFLQESEKEKIEKEKFLYLYKRATRRINKESYQKKMAEFWLWFEKILRKLRIMFLKVDGRIVTVLEKLRKKNVESLEGLREHTEKNINIEKTNEALSKFLNSDSFSNGTKAIGIATKKFKNRFKNDKKVAFKKTGSEAVKPILGTEEENTFLAPEKQETSEIKTEIYQAEYIEVDHSKDKTGDTIIEEKIPEIENESQQKETLLGAFSAEKEPQETLTDITKKDKNTEIEEATIVKNEKTPGEKTETEEEKKIRTRKEQECIEILMENPTDIKAYWKLGIIYSKRHNYEDALACFRQIVKIDPTYTKAKQKAVELMERMKSKTK